MNVKWESVVQFYERRQSPSPDNLNWKEILSFLQKISVNGKSLPQYYCTCMIGGRLLLSHHFRLSCLTGEDDDEIAVARFFMGVPTDFEIAGLNHKSILTVQDEYSKTPLHYLLESGIDNDFKRERYLSLMIDLSDKVDQENNMKFYWNELLLKRDCHHMTPLHVLAENKDLDLHIVEKVIMKLDGSPQTREVIHPLLQIDIDDELPIHYACDDIYEGCGRRLELFLGLDGDGSIYKPMYDSVFYARHDGLTPVMNLLSTFLGDEIVRDKFCADNEWHLNDEVDDSKSFQQLLSLLSSKRGADFSAITSAPEFETFSSCVRILLHAAAKSNTYHSNSEENFEISNEAIHLAASVKNFPSWVLQVEVLNDTSKLLSYDRFGRIPIHSAIIANRLPCLQAHCPESLKVHSLCWETEYEPRSVVQYILEYAHESAGIRDGRGRLPIHLAIHHGCELKAFILPLLTAFQCIAETDPVTNLLPFMLAALDETCKASLDVLYTLLRLDPSLLFGR